MLKVGLWGIDQEREIVFTEDDSDHDQIHKTPSEVQSPSLLI